MLYLALLMLYSQSPHRSPSPVRFSLPRNASGQVRSLLALFSTKVHILTPEERQGAASPVRIRRIPSPPCRHVYCCSKRPAYVSIRQRTAGAIAVIRYANPEIRGNFLVPKLKYWRIYWYKCINTDAFGGAEASRALSPGVKAPFVAPSGAWSTGPLAGAPLPSGASQLQYSPRGQAVADSRQYSPRRGGHDDHSPSRPLMPEAVYMAPSH